jgi:hypothetical protein
MFLKFRIQHDIARINEKLENTEGTNKTDNPENTEGANKTDNPENTEGAIKTDNPENTEGVIKTDNPENTEGAIKTDNPENLVAQGTQYEEKQNKTTTQNVLDIIIRKQTQIT